MTKVYLTVIALLSGSVVWVGLENSQLSEKLVELESELQLEKSKKGKSPKGEKRRMRRKEKRMAIAEGGWSSPKTVANTEQINVTTTGEADADVIVADADEIEDRVEERAEEIAEEIIEERRAERRERRKQRMTKNLEEVADELELSEEVESSMKKVNDPFVIR